MRDVCACVHVWSVPIYVVGGWIWAWKVYIIL